jgi:hypothetical protein
MSTEKGRLGLAPFIGSKGRSEGKKGSVVVIFHGCIVPIVLERIDGEEEEEEAVDGEWTVVGDCNVEGVMHGEVVTWEEEDATAFVLV